MDRRFLNPGLCEVGGFRESANTIKRGSAAIATSLGTSDNARGAFPRRFSCHAREPRRQSLIHRRRKMGRERGLVRDDRQPPGARSHESLRNRNPLRSRTLRRPLTALVTAIGHPGRTTSGPREHRARNSLPWSIGARRDSTACTSDQDRPRKSHALSHGPPRHHRTIPSVCGHLLINSFRLQVPASAPRNETCGGGEFNRPGFPGEVN
jgi:hypothetical protein